MNWHDVAGPVTDAAGAAARLGISTAAVRARARRRRLLRVITTDGRQLYPVWQFDRAALIDGLTEVLSLFPEDEVDGWTLAGWLRTAEPALGTSPYDALLRGGVSDVTATARWAAASLRG